jgi:hypothetical protein
MFWTHPVTSWEECQYVSSEDSPSRWGKALTFGRKVHPARERRLLDIITASRLERKTLKKYHASRENSLKEGSVVHASLQINTGTRKSPRREAQTVHIFMATHAH